MQSIMAQVPVVMLTHIYLLVYAFSLPPSNGSSRGTTSDVSDNVNSAGAFRVAGVATNDVPSYSVF